MARPPRSSSPRGRGAPAPGPRRFVSAGLLVRDRMDSRELEKVAAAFRRQSVALAPLSATRQSVSIPGGEGGDMILMSIGGVAEIRSGAVSGVVATGALDGAQTEDDGLLAEAIKAAMERGFPVLALSDAAAAALKAIDHPMKDEPPAAVLIYRGVRAIDVETGLDEAAKLFRTHVLGAAA